MPNQQEKSTFRHTFLMNIRNISFPVLLMILPAAALAQTTFTKITTGDIVNDDGFSYGVFWGDFNNDEFLDLFVYNTGNPPREDQPAANFLYQNNRNGTFTRV